MIQEPEFQGERPENVNETDWDAFNVLEHQCPKFSPREPTVPFLHPDTDR